MKEAVREHNQRL